MKKNKMLNVATFVFGGITLIMFVYWTWSVSYHVDLNTKAIQKIVEHDNLLEWIEKQK